MSSYDVIVIGTGGVGSAALFHLAQRGQKTLGLDRFPGGHDRGSSHGQTRVIRQAYFEHPDYVPLLRRAYELWEDLQQQCGRQLYHQTGLLEAGPADGVVVPGVLQSAGQHQLDVEQLSIEEAARRFPGFRFPEGSQVVFERQAGYLRVEDCILAYLAGAKQQGAELKTDVSVQSWKTENGEVVVRTDQGNFTAKRLVITAGPWSMDLLSDLGVTLKVLRKHLHWYSAEEIYRQDHGCPVFFLEHSDRSFFYGFPDIDGQGLKVAEHSGGEEINDPLNVIREVDNEDRRRVEAFLASYLPGVSNSPADHAVCMYTSSADEHFLVDRHPQHSQVAFAAGLSGHGFKFAGVLGEVLADLTLEGKTDLPIGFLSCRRPGLQ